MDPPYLGLLKGNYGISGMSWFKDYQKAYINTSRFRPIQHVMGFVLILGYCLEYPHLKRAHEHRATAPSPLAPPQRPRARAPLARARVPARRAVAEGVLRRGAAHPRLRTKRTKEDH